MVSLSNWDKMAARSVVTKRKSALEAELINAVQVNENVGPEKDDGSWGQKGKKNKAKKQKSQEGPGVNGAPKQKLTKGERRRLRRENKRLALVVSKGEYIFGRFAADAETNDRMESDVEATDDRGNLQINHEESPSDSEADQRKAHRGKREGKAHRKDSQVAEEYDAIMDGSFLDNLMGDTIGTQIEATNQPSVDVPAHNEGAQSVDEVEQAVAKKEKKEHKKKKGKNKAYKKGRETLDRELDQYMSGEQGDPKASQARDVDVEDSMIGRAVDLPEPSRGLETAGAQDPEMESQSLESQIRAQISKSQKKKKRKREVEIEVAALNIEDSAISYAGDIEIEDAEAEKKKSKKRKKEKKAKRDSQLQTNDTESIKEAATQQSNAAEAAIENPKEVVVQQKTPKPSPK
jgi:hypothetical protein